MSTYRLTLTRASSEIHDLLSVLMYSNSSRQRSWCSIVTTATLVGSFPTVMFLLHQMIPSSECYQMSIVSWCWNGNTSSATDVCMTQLVS
jgi:hypothetical protein